MSSETQESAQTCPTDNSWIHDGWSFDEWNDDWSSVGWHEGWEQMYDTSASSLSLGGLDVSATSIPKRFESVQMNLDTGAAANTFLLNFGWRGEEESTPTDLFLSALVVTAPLRSSEKELSSHSSHVADLVYLHT